MNLTVWIQSFLIILIGAVGTILFKIGVNITPSISFTEPLSISQFIFSPYIVISFTYFLLGRILLALPLKTTDVGKYMFIITPLTLVTTLAFSYLIFKETITLKQLVGVLLTLSGVVLLGL